ncbi:MAG: aminoacyl-tRNA hydrolase [Bacteroidota bacterium]|nr:aminoacyl-tRNA hydrolase [Bacteroidota bacterium]
MNNYLIVGLGNPGTEYAGTRHNIGFDVVDAFAAKHGFGFRTERLGEIATGKLKGRSVICLKPGTYMNLSGKAIKYWRDKEQIQNGNILVILDELALPAEKLRLRMSGSSGGHNGLKSIEETLETTEYPRLRFGIGNQYPKGMQVEYVLGRWTETEIPLIKKKVIVATELIETYIFQGIAAAMNQYNKLSITL